MKLTKYELQVPFRRKIRVALCADLHDSDPGEALDLLKEQKPDMIAIPGDLADRLDTPGQCGLRFLTGCAAVAPTFYALGNHDKYFDSPDISRRIRETGVQLLDNQDIFFAGMWIGGVSSGFRARVKEGALQPTPTPDLAFLDRFAEHKGFKLLLCHHPEYYPAYVRGRDISLTLSGHAHGGQWCFFGQGLFAPGQGIMPRYTAGVYENRLVVSRGMGDHTTVPRLFNPREVVMLTLYPANQSNE